MRISSKISHAKAKLLVEYPLFGTIASKLELIVNDDIESLGELLDQNWQLKRQVTVGISDLQIDGWYSKGIRAGATGGKLLGAGNGGFMMFFAPINFKYSLCSDFPVTAVTL